MESLNKLEDYIDSHPVFGYKGDEKKDYFNFHKDRYKKILNYITENDFKNIYEPGCYFGHIAIGAKLMDCNVSASDLEENQALVKDRFNELGIEFKTASLDGKQPFEDDSFDLIVFSEVFEHLPFHPSIALRELKSVLKRGGKILITTPNLTRATNRLKMLFGRSIHANILEPYYLGTHYREYTASEISQLCESVGLGEIKSSYIDFDYPLHWIVKLINSVFGIFPSLRSNLWIEVKKGDL